ncbi:hypothetical protein [Mesorhizobium sp. L103C105A0]|uniref:hypothetical protein n=1 Tax=unclassified Mesorhizobium TaxID=325217 RepID=UPI0003D06C35|nr:hypothetical protein [Mesorhizobium sp. L103C105A0]ESZ78684.1 hypothetical protein X726_04555 [Mesorhizobium sp. L103C105A0]
MSHRRARGAFQEKPPDVGDEIDDFLMRRHGIAFGFNRPRPLASITICRYIGFMTKAQTKQELTGKWVVRDSRSGRYVEVRGADSMKSSQLPLKKGVDLTKPIANQALKGGSHQVRKPRDS